MYTANDCYNSYGKTAIYKESNNAAGSVYLGCAWDALKSQLLQHWQSLKPADLEAAGPDRESISRLIQRKYGMAAYMVENYLRNCERTLPLV